MARTDYRHWLAEAHQKASHDFDRAVMTLSAGALGISLAFIHDVAPNPGHKWLLAVAWTALATSLLLTLVSFLASQATIRQMIDEVDQGRGDRLGAIRLPDDGAQRLVGGDVRPRGRLPGGVRALRSLEVSRPRRTGVNPRTGGERPPSQRPKKPGGGSAGHRPPPPPPAKRKRSA